MEKCDFSPKRFDYAKINCKSGVVKLEKYKGKYRIQSHRRPNWDYSAEALYFLTIVTQHRDCNLGEIVEMNGRIEMMLSDYGKIVEQEWLKSFGIRQELKSHVYVIMPNHIHAIVEIYNQNRDETIGDIGGGRDTRPCVSAATNVATNTADAITTGSQEIIKSDEILSIKRNSPIRLPKSVSSFIAGFKSAVNTKIDDYIDEHNLNIPKYNRNNHFFQPNYHDHIIRNQTEYNNIYHYIKKNPSKWHDDRLNR